MKQFLLAAHIGGIKARLSLLAPEQVKSSKNFFKSLHETRYPIGDFQDIVPMVRQFLKESKQVLKSDNPIVPDKACFAVAAPIEHNKCKFTNLNLQIDGDRLVQKLGIGKIQLINDFQAIAYGLQPPLDGCDYVTLQKGKPDKNGLIAVMGAATGLGKAFLVKQNGDYRAYATEGGHVDFTPHNDQEFRLSQYILKQMGDRNKNLPGVSAEQIVSGRGIVAIYSFLRDEEHYSESPQIGPIIKTWQKEDGICREVVDPAALITAAALAKGDRLCEKAMQMFVEAYGSELGNFALQFLPYGGLYVAGGIAPQILPLIQEGTFLNAFFQKDCGKTLLEELKKIPIYVVINLKMGLKGAVRYVTTYI